jgi:hypothetical protein
LNTICNTTGGYTPTNGYAWKLKKNGYGLKQANRLWNKILKGILIRPEFIQSQADLGLYLRKNGTAVTVHVDDLLGAGTNGDLNNVEICLEKE